MDTKLKEKVDQVLEQQCLDREAELDYKLNQARNKALSSKPKKLYEYKIRYIAASILAVFTLYSVLPFIPNAPDITINPASEITISITEIELLYQLNMIEDLTFYEWLSQENEFTTI